VAAECAAALCSASDAAAELAVVRPCRSACPSVDQLSHGIPLVTSVGWFATNISEALIGAYVLQRLRAPRDLFETFAGVLLFFAVGVAGVIGLTSFLDAAVVVATGMGGGTGTCGAIASRRTLWQH